ncbi:AAA family ATPase [Roseateles oligotrophus]|uniref:AAA family ATPase n=1 Tax=Roseateles oligotrophus TaxID=1769250 RepID=A0ABT2Y8F6_9BURK|nr:AAA family ATPase [Roseateles oligotrophus]MCV2366577.1 AAA family ATPase [Roseateles oligotrophus]
MNQTFISAEEQQPADCISDEAGWKQMNLPFTSEFLWRESILDTRDVDEDLKIGCTLDRGCDPVQAICSHDAIHELAKSVELQFGSEDILRRNANLLQKLGVPGGRFRRLRRLPSSWRTDIDELEGAFPNFGDVLDYVRSMASLAELGDGVIRLDALVFDGSPGTGKSIFAEQLASVIAGGFERMQMSTAESGSQIGGSATTWSNSRPGLIFEALINGYYANPLVLLDELDKAPTSSGERFSPIGPLYQLLERPAARTFRDLSVPSLAVDASAVTWVATTNECHLLPAPILSRLYVFDVKLPSASQATRVVRSVMRKLSEEEPTLAKFKLTEDAVSKLATSAPRAMRGLVRRACGQAALASRWTVGPGDVSDAGPKRPSIGFCA